MDQKRKLREIQEWKESVNSELYEELLSRYERILVFAGQLQEKFNQQKLLSEKNQALEKKNEHLKKHAALDASYILLLEKSLKALGVISDSE